jgi:hypothetical protein
VLTHAHPDHAFGLARGAPCPVWAPKQCWDTLPQFPIAERHNISIERRHHIESLVVQAFTVEHSIRAPAVGYRISAGNVSVFYAPDLVFIHKRSPALRNLRAYIGDGATLNRPLVRRRGDTLIGHTTIATQIRWCAAEDVPLAIITHCGTQIVTAPMRRMTREINDLGRAVGVRAVLAYDGLVVMLREKQG